MANLSFKFRLNQMLLAITVIALILGGVRYVKNVREHVRSNSKVTNTLWVGNIAVIEEKSIAEIEENFLGKSKELAPRKELSTIRQ